MFNSVSLTLYFNSRPHGGRHSHGAGIGSSFCISTHALTEGDVDKVPIIPTPSISTHALTEGDSFQKPPEALKRSFQLTPSRRATVYRETIRYNRNISTHALTEGDRPAIHGKHCNIYFNSRPHGGRRNLQGHPRSRTYFNSRPHGGRLSDTRCKTDSCISTHALTEGDCDLIRDKIHMLQFQLTPSRRATSTENNFFTSDIFQLTPSRRATMEPTISTTDATFQLTPSRRATILHESRFILTAISTHALTEGDIFSCSAITASRKFQLTPSRRATANLDKFFF